jgi:hypothetical protein
MAAQELFTTTLFNDANLVSYYRFEGNSTDAKGTSNGSDTNITYNSTNPKFGQKAVFNGTTSDMQNGTTLLNVATNGSLTAWVYPTASGAANDADTNHITSILSKGNIFYIWGQLSTDKIRVKMFDTGSVSRIYDSNTALTLNAWNFICLTWDGSGTTFYLNGVADGTSAFTQANLNASTNGTQSYIGIQAGGAFDFTGSIDDLAYWSRTLTAGDISNLYNGFSQGSFLFNFF